MPECIVGILLGVGFWSRHFCVLLVVFLYPLVHIRNESRIGRGHQHDHAFLELAERLLQKEGYSAIATDAPESVLQIARTVRPAAIMIDILMPGLNGWDVINTLKSDPVTARIPVLMISVLEERQKAMDHGAIGVVSKPFDGNKLKSALAMIEAAQRQSAAA